MARKATKNKGPEFEKGPAGKDAVRFVVGLAFGALAVYTFVSLMFYLFTWADDQSLLSNPDLFKEFVDTGNGGGVLGFVWSNFLISKLFGLGAFGVPFIFAAFSLSFLRLRNIRLLRVCFLSIFGIILFSLAFSYLFSFTSFDTWFGSGAGGSYGYYVNMWICNVFGKVGAGILLLFLMIVWAVFLNSRVILWFDRLFMRMAMFFERRKPAIAAAETGEDAGEGAGKGAGEGAGEDAGLSEGSEDRESRESGMSPNDGMSSGDRGEQDSENTGEERNIDGYDGSGGQGGHKAHGGHGMDNVQRNGKTAEEPVFEIIDEQMAGPAENASASGHAGNTAEDSGEKTAEGGKDVDIKPVEVLKGEDDFLADIPEEVLSTMFDPRLDLSSYQSPSVDLLEDYRNMIFVVSREELEKNNRKIVKTLADYRIGVEKISARIGPTVTLYEIVPAAGVRVSQIKRLEEDIALSLAARGVRVVTLVGTNAIGIEVANEKPSVVPMKSVLSDPKFLAVKGKYDLPVVIGRTISNEPMIFDLAKMPHLLVAGATGQGKSVGLNAIIASLLYTKHPSELKMVLVDPKKVELSLYSKLERHFLAKLPDSEEAIITDTQKVIYTLKSLCIEMDSRYDLLKAASVRNVKEYNEKFLSRRLNPNKGHSFMPFIVVVIDEFADLLMTAGREVEEPIARLAQLARAIGIHLVIATQRPTTNIITGTIKANFPARIAFRVISSVDSKTILDQVGANQLIGRGDMLISTGSDLTRVQCAFIDTKEVERIADFIGSQRGYPTAHYLPEYTGDDQDGGGVGEVDLQKRDKLFEEAARLVVSTQQGSTSMIQRKMNLGYNRAGRIMDQLEAAGIVGPYEGSKSRQVLISDFNSLDRILGNL